MSIEAMSGGSAVGVATGGELSVGIKGATSLGTTPDLGGTHMPRFDNNALFETFEIPTPSLEFPEGGKAIHDISPFENTQVLWQAQTDLITKPAPLQTNIALEETHANIMPTDGINISNRVIREINEIPEFIPEPGIELSQIVDDITTDFQPIEEGMGEIAQPEPALDLDLKTNIFIQEMSGNKLALDEIIEPEVMADAKQAAKVETALMAIGNTQEEAHATALKVLIQAQEKNLIVPDNKIKPPEIYFGHDTKADTERKKIAEVAVEHAVEKAIKNGRDKITGYDLANEMPESPQPQTVKSEIVEKGEDGSYDEFINEIRGVASITSDEEAEQVIQKAVENNHAVLRTSQPTSLQASEREVRKVLKTGVIFQNKP